MHTKCEILASKLNNQIRSRLSHSRGSHYHRPYDGAGRLCTSTTGTIMGLILMVVIGLLCFPNNTHATDSISISLDTSLISLDLVPTSANGQFAESSSANISVSTTGLGGYTLSIASTDSTDLTNTTDSNSKITSISSNLTNSDFSASANTQYNNKWGYKPSQYVTANDGSSTTVTNTGNDAVFRPLPGAGGEILAVTECANGTSSCTSASDTYTISMGARANSDAASGSYQSTGFNIVAVANWFVPPCDDTKLCVEYEGNGLTIEGDSINRVNYDSTTTQQQMTKYSHTPNISDAGVQDGNYPNSANLNDVVTIDGATSLHIKLTYAGEGAGWDWVSFWPGNHPDYTAYNNYSTGIQNCGGGSVTNGKYGGGSGTTVECDISTSDGSVTFAFRSDGGGVGNGYGYYAVITGTGTVLSRIVSSGEYATPTGTNALFHGWSTTATTPGGGLPTQVEYTDEPEVKSKMPGENGEEKVLYAVWQQGQQITFTKDSNVTSIEVLNSDGTTAGTITTSGQSLVLAQGNTYTLKPTHATGYITNVITIASGAGTLSGKQFTVGAGVAIINITSRYVTPMQNWSGCSSLASGNTLELLDTRDSQVYLVGKLADGKCWMLDNLALDLVAKIDNMNQDNTNASNTTLGYLKNGGGSTTSGDATYKYASAGVSNWTSSYSYSAPLANISNKDTVPQGSDPLKTEALAGNWKVGGYYNYCAASAGSYCYGSGTSAGTSSGNATEDICPKGWRMPGGSDTIALTATPPTGEYRNLGNYITGTTSGNYTGDNYTNFRSALRLPLSGYFYNGSANYQGSYGYFWSSTRYSNSSMYSLYLTTSNVNPSDYYDRFSGYSVRCVLMPINTYTLNYDKNTTDNVANMPSSQSDSVHDDIRHTFTLPTDSSNIPTRSGYTFAGWGTSSDQGIPTYKYENGSFTPSEATVYPSDNPETLYAIWHQPQTITFTFDSHVSSVEILDLNDDSVGTISTSGTTISLASPLTYTLKPTYATGYTANTITIASGAGTLSGKQFTVGAGTATINITSRQMLPMQNYNCSNLAVGDTDMVYDTRDNTPYIIGKLADGKCWMLDNLALDLVAKIDNMNQDNTNASNTTLGYLKNGGGSTTSGNATYKYASAGVSNWTSSYSYSAPLVNISNKDTVPQGSDPLKTEALAGNWKVGGYYNYCAASAGSYCYGSGTSAGTSSGNATEDICPKGWRMPTGSSSGEFQALYNNSNYNNYNNYRLALRLPLSGYFNSGSAYGQGSGGYFWSSTRSGNNDMYYLYLSTSNAGPSSSSYRYRGYSVRCVLSS